MSYIDDLVDIQNDAFDNLYDIKIELPTNLVGQNTEGIADYELRVRAGDITIPEPKLEKYKLFYKTVDIEKPKPKITLERKLSIIFKIDSEYRLYTFLKKWENLNFNSNGMYRPLKSGDYGKIAVSAYTGSNISGDDSATQVGQKWEFYNVWMAGKEAGLSFKRESGGDPLKVTCEFNFFKMTNS